jgi:hypothetical protein
MALLQLPGAEVSRERNPEQAERRGGAPARKVSRRARIAPALRVTISTFGNDGGGSPAMTSKVRLRKYGLVAVMIVVIAVGAVWGARFVVREILPYTADQGHQN